MSKRKIASYSAVNWDEMKWRSIDTSKDDLGHYEDAVFFSLEELDTTSHVIQKNSNGYDVRNVPCEEEWDKDTLVKSVSKLKNRNKKRKKLRENNSDRLVNELTSGESISLASYENNQWGNNSNIYLHSLLQKSLLLLNFVQPTPIQLKAIPFILEGKCDLVGAAETGSGKTLSFGLPLIHTLLREWAAYEKCVCPFSLIMAPTRELVLQIASVIRSVCDSDPIKNVARIEVVAVVGGMSEQKQRRQLCGQKAVHFLVATPGRLCELLFDEDDIISLSNLSKIRFLVVDEVDRMVEEGHFPELERIFGQIRGHEEVVSRGLDPVAEKQLAKKGKDVDEDDENIYEQHNETGKESELKFDVEDGQSFDPIPSGYSFNLPIDEDINSINKSGDNSNMNRQVVLSIHERQTLLFSATATGPPIEQNNQKLKKRKKNKIDIMNGKLSAHDESILRSLSRDLQQVLSTVAVQPKLRVVDVTVAGNQTKEKEKLAVKKNDTQTGSSVTAQKQNKKESQQKSNAIEVSVPSVLPAGLTQYEMITPAEDKDLFAIHFLLKFPGRTLLFVNSIKAARRLDGLLRALEIPCRVLHAQQQQRQRLRALEAFRDSSNCVLVATDVAARGLDVPLVQSVLHYDIPRSPQLYQHRSGRTARAGQTGRAVSLVSPEDAPHHTVVCAAQSVAHFATLPVDLRDLDELRERVSLAKKIFTHSFVEAQQSKQRGWLEKLAEDAGLEQDELLQKEQQSTSKDMERKKTLVKDRAKLKHLLETEKRKPPPKASSIAGFRDNRHRKRSFVVVAR